MPRPTQKSADVLGILAGDGELPYIAARNALKQGQQIRIFYFVGQPPPDLQQYSEAVVITRLYRSVLKAFQRHKISRLLLLGKATRNILYNKPRFDWRTLWLLLRMRSQSDHSIFETVANVIEKTGIRIISQLEYLNTLNLPAGRYGKKLKASELADIEFGLHYAQELNRLDIGQTIVAGDLSILSLEAAEGTDQCILRGGGLYKKKGAVVCKLPKQNHDLRFDIPAIGKQTIQSMIDSNCRAIVFRSDCTIILNPVVLIDFANTNQITLLALTAATHWDRQDLKKINASNPRRVRVTE